MSAIKCGQCGHENDLTRVFCQNCGTRLERPEPTPEGPSITPVPIKRQTKARGPSGMAMLGQAFKGVAYLVFLGALLAVLIQVGRRPDGLPEESPVNEASATALFESVRAFASSPFRRTLDLKQEQINNYLASRLSADDSAGAPPGAQFARAFVVLDDGTFRFFVERRYLGFPVYFQVECEPVAGPEGATVVVRKGAIGRLSLPSFLLRLVQARAIQPTVDALAEPLEVLGRADRVTVQPGFVRVGWPGAAARR